jgi:hypothetical protein
MYIFKLIFDYDKINFKNILLIFDFFYKKKKALRY